MLDIDKNCLYNKNRQKVSKIKKEKNNMAKKKWTKIRYDIFYIHFTSFLMHGKKRIKIIFATITKIT